MKKAFLCKLLPGMIFILMTGNLFGQQIDYRAQSLFIYKFTKFITWPEEKLKGEFKIGVYGNSPILNELEIMASLKKAADGLTIKVMEINSLDNITDYNIIYIPSSRSRQINEIMEKVGSKPVLVVAEREGLAGKGASISFLILENEVLKFEVNMSVLQKQKLEISEELLKLGYKI